MAQRITVETSKIGEELSLFVQAGQEVNEQTQDAMRMLVDSDHLAFLYVLDTEDDLIYVDLGVEHWEKMDQAAAADLKAVLHFRDGKTMTLSALTSEMEYLVSNIKGNANYGEKMVSAVERSFPSIISKTEEGNEG
ncbi:hypothetical protein ACFQPF_09000 [Fictibacillus iocasae]|uniref:Uncharacterized protein n=1 Tax=Fictibacillus iocasae TaxID=2715437 RepID=A0ABW2NUW4_9BACL